MTVVPNPDLSGFIKEIDAIDNGVEQAEHLRFVFGVFWRRILKIFSVRDKSVLSGCFLLFK